MDDLGLQHCHSCGDDFPVEDGETEGYTGHGFTTCPLCGGTAENLDDEFNWEF